MHVAEALWLALACRALCPKLFFAALVFFMVILLGSINLGFHYAADGAVGIVAVLAIWFALRRTVVARPSARLTYTGAQREART
jgi:hypothetical protein